MMTFNVAHNSPISRISTISSTEMAQNLNAFGNATIKGLLSPDECAQLTAFYDKDDPFRSHIHMARHGFGKGEYKYFSYPLPEAVQVLRTALYPLLVPTANEWNSRMGIETHFPPQHAEYLKLCHAAGQNRPTPLLLQYTKGDFNCLHQDVYGELIFPLQVAVLLSRPSTDFLGGEFILTEQRPRMQSRAEVVPLTQGDAVIFAVRDRPVEGTKRDYRVKMRHGVSRLTRGTRYTLGVIFHDAD